MFRGDSHFLARIDADLGLLYKMGKQQQRAREHLQKADLPGDKAEALSGKIDAVLAALGMTALVALPHSVMGPFMAPR